MTILEENVYLQLYARAPAPCRDYYGLTVSSNFVILNIWNISHGPHVYPKRQKTPLNEFEEDKYLQTEIRRLFGQHVLSFAMDLAARRRNLQFLPARLFLRILRLLAANDILRLSQTSKIFFELCNSEAAWKILFRKRLKKSVLLQDNKRAESIGWKGILREKLHFMMMHAGKTILSKKQTPLNNNNNNKTGAKSQNVAADNNKNTSASNNRLPSFQAKKLSSANPKTPTNELNNKAHSAHLSAKKQDINFIKNVDREIKPKATKSASQIKSDAKKTGVNKSAPAHHPEKLNAQANKRPTINRTAATTPQAKALSKLPPAEAEESLKNNVLKNNLQKKVLCKSAQLSSKIKAKV